MATKRISANLSNRLRDYYSTDKDNLASPLLWKAFHLSSKCHGCYPFPLKWDPLQKQFSVNPSSRQIKFWTLSIIFLIIGIGTLLCPYLFIMEAILDPNRTSYVTAFLLLIIAILSQVAWQVSLTIVRYRHDLVHFFNSMLQMERSFPCSSKGPSFNDHLIGATVLYVTSIFVVFPYTSVPVAVHFRMDPLSYLLRIRHPLILSTYPLTTSILTYTVILFIDTMAVVIVSQSYAFILLFMTTTLQIYSKLLLQISQLSPLESRLKAFRHFCILHKYYADPAAIASGVSLTVGFILSIMLAMVGIQGFDKFPLPIYLYSQLTEFTILILVSILLPSTFQVYERSLQMIRLDWKRDLAKGRIVLQGSRRAQVIREMQALRPVYFGFYKIFKLTQGWGAGYVFNMIDSIMDGNLTFSLD